MRWSKGTGHSTVQASSNLGSEIPPVLTGHIQRAIFFIGKIIKRWVLEIDQLVKCIGCREIFNACSALTPVDLPFRRIGPHAQEISDTGLCMLQLSRWVVTGH